MTSFIAGLKLPSFLTVLLVSWACVTVVQAVPGNYLMRPGMRPSLVPSFARTIQNSNLIGNNHVQLDHENDEDVDSGEISVPIAHIDVGEASNLSGGNTPFFEREGIPNYIANLDATVEEDENDVAEDQSSLPRVLIRVSHPEERPVVPATTLVSALPRRFSEHIQADHAALSTSVIAHPANQAATFAEFSSVSDLVSTESAPSTALATMFTPTQGDVSSQGSEKHSRDIHVTLGNEVDESKDEQENNGPYHSYRAGQQTTLMDEFNDKVYQLYVEYNAATQGDWRLDNLVVGLDETLSLYPEIKQTLGDLSYLSAMALSLIFESHKATIDDAMQFCAFAIGQEVSITLGFAIHYEVNDGRVWPSPVMTTLADIRSEQERLYRNLLSHLDNDLLLSSDQPIRFFAQGYLDSLLLYQDPESGPAAFFA